MKYTVTLDRNDLLEAITEYLNKHGKEPVNTGYYPWVKFNIGKLEIGSQRESEQIETVVSATCQVK